MRASVAVACGNELGESATWHPVEQALYWTDIRAPALHRFDPASGACQTWPLPDLCGGVVPAASGVVLALRRELVRFDTATAQMSHLCTIEPASLDNRLNESKCDRQGRLWVGSMRDFATAVTGSLYRIHGNGVERVMTDIAIPNSLGWSPDGRTMYFADTLKERIEAFRYDPATGAIGARRSLVPAGALPGRPDGCTVDAEGNIWTTRFGAGCVIRATPDGRETARVTLPTQQPTSCALGGARLTTLFVTTAWQRLDPQQRQAQPSAGHLFAVEVDVPGLPETIFAAAETREVCT